MLFCDDIVGLSAGVAALVFGLSAFWWVVLSSIEFIRSNL